MEGRIVRVKLTGNAYYPKFEIIRDFKRREYWANETRIKMLNTLFASHKGKTFVDFKNSAVEIYVPKRNHTDETAINPC